MNRGDLAVSQVAIKVGNVPSVSDSHIRNVFRVIRNEPTKIGRLKNVL